MAVAANSQTILFAPHSNNPLRGVNWKTPDPDAIKVRGTDIIRAGDWIDLRADEVIDLDILIGERPGGAFYAYLGWQEKGAHDEADPAGNPILPFFRTTDAPFPESERAKARFPFTDGPPLESSSLVRLTQKTAPTTAK